MDARVIAADSTAAAAREVVYRPKPDGTIDPIGETGWFLQRERERRGEGLEQASEATGIHPIHLMAIEVGDLRRMPERNEALQMVGLYALYMGFEAEPIRLHYAQYLPRAPRPAHPADPAPLSSAKVIKFGKGAGLFGRKLGIPSLPGGSGSIVASCLAAIALFAAANWFMAPAPEMLSIEDVIQSSDPIETSSVDPAVEVKDADMPDDDNPAAAVLPGGQSAVGVEPSSGADNEHSLDGLTALIEKAVGEAPAAKPTNSKKKIATIEPPPPGPSVAKSRLVLKAKAPVWIRIQDAKGDVVVTRMLMPGDNYRVPDREGLVVIARDGGMLLYEIDGKEQGVLGTPGEILVGRPLDVKSLQKRG
jgi:cytoskeleton protein RodZ